MPMAPAGHYVAPPNPIGSLAQWSQILIATTVAIGVIVNLAPDNSVTSLLGGLNTIVSIAAGVVTVIWLYRVADNSNKMGRRVTFGPLWAIFGWLILPMLWIIPALQMQELWKASDASPDWQRSSTNWKIWAWFACAPLAVISGIIFGGSVLYSLSSADINSEAEFESTIEQAADQSIGAYVMVEVFTVAAAVLFILFSRELTRRQEQLIANPPG